MSTLKSTTTICCKLSCFSCISMVNTNPAIFCKRWYFQCQDPAPPISNVTQRYDTAADKDECLSHRPVALTLRMSMNIDIRGEVRSPTWTTSRMCANFRHWYPASHSYGYFVDSFQTGSGQTGPSQRCRNSP